MKKEICIDDIFAYAFHMPTKETDYIIDLKERGLWLNLLNAMIKGISIANDTDMEKIKENCMTQLSKYIDRLQYLMDASSTMEELHYYCEILAHNQFLKYQAQEVSKENNRHFFHMLLEQLKADYYMEQVIRSIMGFSCDSYPITIVNQDEILGISILYGAYEKGSDEDISSILQSLQYIINLFLDEKRKHQVYLLISRIIVEEMTRINGIRTKLDGDSAHLSALGRKGYHYFARRLQNRGLFTSDEYITLDCHRVLQKTIKSTLDVYHDCNFDHVGL